MAEVPGNVPPAEKRWKKNRERMVGYITTGEKGAQRAPLGRLLNIGNEGLDPFVKPKEKGKS